MAQKRFFEYQAALISDDENKSHLGQYFPGVYAGFDSISYPGTGSTFDLTHALTGVTPTQPGGVVSNPTGLVCSNHGVLIAEDAAITGLTLASNVGNPDDRYDLIIVDHDYILSAGGQAATYSIVQGAFSDPNPPALPAANTQVILGIIKLAAGATEVDVLNDIISPPAAPATPVGTFTRSTVPDMGNIASAKLNKVNKFNKALHTADLENAIFETISGSNVVLQTQDSSNTIIIPDGGGSSYWIHGIKTPSGTAGTKLTMALQLLSTDDVCLVNTSATVIPAGYSKILFPSHLNNYPVGGGNPVGAQLMSGDIVTLEFFNTYWAVTGIQFANATTQQAYLNNIQPYPTAYFRGDTGGNVSIGTVIGLVTTHNPSNSHVSLSGGEIRVNTAGTYKVVFYWGLTGARTAYERMLLTTDSSNEPALAYSGGLFGSEPDFKTGQGTIEDDRVSYITGGITAISAGAKFNSYVNPNGVNTHAYVQIEITRIS